jgi:hypothetical protein
MAREQRNEEMIRGAMIAFAKTRNSEYIWFTECCSLTLGLHASFNQGIYEEVYVVCIGLGGLAFRYADVCRRRDLAGTEFHGFFDSSTVADDLFGDAFDELPDKI